MPRLGHKKSRTGCVQCKRRRVKCDEQRPCNHCARHGVECSLTLPDAPPAHQPASSSASGDSPQNPASQASSSSNQPEYRDRLTSTSSKSQSSASSSRHETPALTWSSSQGIGTRIAADHNPFDMLGRTIGERDIMCRFIPHLPLVDWHRDLQLLHHFSTVTFVTISEMESARHCYQVVFPQVGYSSKAVMHGILGVAALHLAYLRPDQRSKWLVISTNHQNHAISGFRLTLPSVTPENCEELYTLSALTTMLRCASLSFPTDTYQPDPIDDMAETFMLMCGVNEVLTTSYQWVACGPLQPMLVPERVGPYIPFDSTECIPLDEFGLQPQFDALKLLAAHESFDPAIRKTLASAVASLSLCYQRILVQPPDREPGLLLMWPIRLSSEFMFLLRQRHPAALILLAHYCVAFHNHAYYWWLGDRGKRCIGAIAEAIEPAWRDHLQWPLDHVADDANIGKHTII